MSDFITFARAHGVLIEQLIEDGRWHRVPTVDKPKKCNGAYRYTGTYGHVQDHASMADPELWQPNKEQAAKIDHAAIARNAAEAAARIRADAEKAAKKAGWILSQCELAPHDYMALKGFPDEKVNVWVRDGAPIMVLPMRRDGKMVGCQFISKTDDNPPKYEKRFLTGQRTDLASFIFDNKGAPVFTEGFATAMSVRAAMQALRMRYKIIVCFSAGNMAKLCKLIPGGIVVGERDHPSKQVPTEGGMGMKVAVESGKPFWMPEEVGQDFNDYSKRVGIFTASQSLRKVLLSCQ